MCTKTTHVHLPYVYTHILTLFLSLTHWADLHCSYTVCMCMLVYTSIHCIHVLFLSVVAVLVHLCMWWHGGPLSTLGPQLVSLAGGPTPTEGRVELYYNGSYGTICRIGWDLVDATVVSGQYCMYCPDTTKCDVLQEMHLPYWVLHHPHTSFPHLIPTLL